MRNNSSQQRARSHTPIGAPRRAGNRAADSREPQRPPPRAPGRADSREPPDRFDRPDYAQGNSGDWHPGKRGDNAGGDYRRSPADRQGRGRDRGRSDSRACGRKRGRSDSRPQARRGRACSWSRGRRSPSYRLSPNYGRSRSRGYGGQQRRSDSRDRSRSKGRGNNDETTEYLEFPRRMMGKVIGKQGATIKDIRSQSGANIQVAEKGSDKCEFTIRGSFRAVSTAKNTILDIADGDEAGGGGDARGGGGYRERDAHRERDGDDWRGYSNSSNSNSKGKVLDESMEFPLDLAGRIIGSRGSQIAEIRQHSGAQVHVDKLETCCKVRITGTPDQVDHARDLVRRAVDTGPSQAPQHPSRREDSMQVPSNQMGRIIGKGGETVKQLQNDSGAKIDINTKEQPDIVRIAGSDEAIARAKSMINDILDRAGERDSYGSQNSYGSYSSQKTEETLEVPPSMIGRIIGKGGEMIMQLQSDSGAKIQIDKDRQGTVYLSGSTEAVADAKRLILDMRDAGVAAPNDTQRRLSRAEEIMEVPPSSMGKIIGRGGETITQLQRDSGAKIDINKDEPGIVRLTGSPEDVAYAKKLISQTLNSAGNNDSRQPSKLEETMTVPESMMGRIIGKGGEKIMQLQQESGAKLDIKKDQPGIVRLTGPPDAIDHAKQLILEIVDGGGKGSGKSSAGGDGSQGAETMELPARMVQHVVGKDGEGLKNIERSSGVRIDIDTKEGNFKLHMSGASKSIEYAQSLIFDAMEQAAFNDPGSASGQGWGMSDPQMASGGAVPQWPEQSTSNYHTAGGPSWHPGEYGGAAPWHSAEHGGDHGNTMMAAPPAPPAPPMYGKGGGCAPWHGYAPPDDFHKRKRGRSSSSSSSSSERRKRKAAKKEMRGRQDDSHGQQQASWAAWPQAAESAWPQYGAYVAAAASKIDLDEL